MTPNEAEQRRPAMTPDEQRIAIAEVCGIHVCSGCFHEINPECCHCGDPMDRHGYESGHSPVPMGCTCGYDKAEKMQAQEPCCPDYLRDLNACAEFEKTLTDDWNVYLGELFKVTNPDPRFCNSRTIHIQNYLARDFVTATAPQRCEAFLKTKNLWSSKSLAPA